MEPRLDSGHANGSSPVGGPEGFGERIVGKVLVKLSFPQRTVPFTVV